MAPSITETLFVLGLGDRVVGVTNYCNFPPQARTKSRIGGYYDPNYEAISTLRPDLVIILTEHGEAQRYLRQLDLDVLVLNHADITGILKSIRTVGAVCGAAEEASKFVQGLEYRMEEIRHKTAGLPRPRVMVSVGRNMGSGTLEDVYISGRNNFYDEMISLGGGVNAYQGDVAFPIMSGEGIIRINPEIIIDMVPDLDKKGWDEAVILKEWQTVSQVDAVKYGRVYVFGEDYVVIPGPRFIHILEKMARVLHPELDWE
jgi:iron complex transport system substrate-binding protein